MIKGHVAIELHNHDTGSRERIEGDNMITRAVADIIRLNGGSGNRSMDSFMPIAQKALGGLLLFDNNIIEGYDNIHLPSEAHLLGFANRTVNTANPMRGSYNALESGNVYGDDAQVPNGYRSVWDFSTTQCNGTLRALALTSVEAGADPAYQQYYYTLKTYYHSHDSSNFGYIIKYDKETQYIYAIELTSNVYDSSSKTYTKTYTIFKKKFPLYEYGCRFGVVDNSSWNCFPIKQVTVTMSQSDNVVPATLSFDGYAYTYERSYDSKTNITTYTILRINLEDFELEVKTLTFENVNLTNYTAVISNGFLYAKNYAGKKLYKINLSSGTIVATKNVSTTFDLLSPMQNGLVRVRSYRTYGILYPDMEIVSTTTTNYSSVEYSRTFEDGMFIGTNEGSTGSYTDSNGTSHYYCYRNTALKSNYLGTIYNLSSPIQKTAATSMKVIYTLQDVEE